MFDCGAGQSGTDPIYFHYPGCLDCCSRLAGRDLSDLFLISSPAQPPCLVYSMYCLLYKALWPQLGTGTAKQDPAPGRGSACSGLENYTRAGTLQHSIGYSLEPGCVACWPRVQYVVSGYTAQPHQLLISDQSDFSAYQQS